MITLYRKYRPQTFAEVIGQRHIVQTLTNAIKNSHIGQAYLFTGPRGTGKTTMARIFAKAVNCANLVGEERAGTKLSIRRSPAEADSNQKKSYEPCGICDICKNITEGRSLDIIEIDAASNTGVDNIRELRETVKLPPSQAKYKVYIIDEAHMLSQGAFNALLKTLEEPPSHVIFILATTAIHKIPETILSRCQRFDFVRLPLDSIIKKLSIIAKSEGVAIDKESLEMVAIAAEGGMRDAESLLAQVIALEDKNITSKEVEEILGTADRQFIEKMAENLLAKDALSALALVNELSEGGYNLEIFAKSLLNYLRQLMIVSVNVELAKSFSYELTAEQMEKMKDLAKKSGTVEILKIIDSFVEVQNRIKSSFIPQLPLELAIIKTTKQPTTNDQQLLINKTDIKEISNSKLQSQNEKPPAFNSNQGEQFKSKDSSIKDAVNQEKADISKKDEIAAEKSSDLTLELIQGNWNKLLDELKPLNHSLTALLLNCQPVRAENNIITIAVKYSFYKERLNENQNKLTIEKVLSKILGSSVKIKAVSEEEAGIKISAKQQAVSDKQEGKNGSLLDEAMKIMGGKIVEE